MTSNGNGNNKGNKNNNGKKNGNGKKMGRPPILDPALPLLKDNIRAAPGKNQDYTNGQVQDLFDALRAGVHKETACKYARIHKDTFYDWYRKGDAERLAALKEDREPVTALKCYVDFSDEIDRASAEIEVRAALNISAMSKKSLSASVFLLQAHNKEDWKTADTPQQPGSISDTNVIIKVVPAGAKPKGK